MERRLSKLHSTFNRTSSPLLVLPAKCSPTTCQHTQPTHLLGSGQMVLSSRTTPKACTIGVCRCGHKPHVHADGMHSTRTPPPSHLCRTFGGRVYPPTTTSSLLFPPTPSADLQPIYHGMRTPACSAVVPCCSGASGLQHASFGEVQTPHAVC